MKQDALFSLPLRAGDLRTRVLLGFASHLAVNISIVTPLIDHFTRGLFSTGRKVVPWHPPLLTVLTRN